MRFGWSISKSSQAENDLGENDKLAIAK